MDRRRFLLASLAGALVPTLTAEAQQATKVARVGYLSASAPEWDKTWLAAFRQGMRDLGYVERQNLVIEERYAEDRAERLPALAAELDALKIDVLVMYGVWMAKQLPIRVPVVFTVSADPVGAGLAVSLARPGGNMTGLSDTHADVVPKRLEFLRQVAPSVARVAVLFNPTNETSRLQIKTAQAAAPAVGMTLVPLDVRGPDPRDIDRAFAAISAERAGALLVIAEPTLAAHRGRIADFAVKHRLPTIGTVRLWAAAGFLLSYGTDFHDLWRRAATYVDKILKGAKPGDLPIEQPTKFELIINLKTAKALGLTIPPSLLARADQVIE